jgi:predicted unusual protein kinase regulating ubiquinone biosynthesis (AarF/ABC1/UbiB family)
MIRTSVLDLFRRSLQIAGAVALAGAVFVRHRLAMRETDATPPRRGIALVRLCTQLGATFIKVGQIASTRLPTCCH